MTWFLMDCLVSFGFFGLSLNDFAFCSDLIDVIPPICLVHDSYYWFLYLFWRL